MILQKTGLQEIPKSCLDCTVSCRLPAKKSSYDYVLKKEFFNKRHEDCPLVSKADICREFYEKLMKRLDYDCVVTRQEIINNAVMVFEEMEQEE